jgi:arylsulfatase A-like enzyme
MTRRTFLGGFSTAALSSSQSRQPNVVLLSVDDMNDWVGCLNGYPGVKTPNIDRLARQGVLFSDAHCPSPLCCPSRTAVFTGLRPSTSGIYTNEQPFRPALPECVTLPEYLRNNGYYAAGAGKVLHHVAGFNPREIWDEFQLQQFDDPWYRRTEWYPWVKKVPPPRGHPFNGLSDFPGEFDWGTLPGLDEQAYGDMAAVRWAEQFLQRNHSKPFFACVGLWHPHIPMFAPQRYFDLYPPRSIRLPLTRSDDLDDLPAVGRQLAAARRPEHERIVKEGKWKEAVRAYLACISFADAMVGRVTQAIAKSRYADNTILVFWSDNGWHLGEKQHWHKSTLWQRSTHVPLIFQVPGAQFPVQPRRQPVTLLDIYATVVQLCGLQYSLFNESETLVPVLRDPKAKRDPALITYLPDNHAVCTERWRYIRYRDGGEELYDRVNDPHEFRNLASDRKHTALKAQLRTFMPQDSAPPQPDRTAYRYDAKRFTFVPK